MGTVNHDETGQSELCVLFPLSVLQGKKVQLVHGYKRAFLPHSFPLKTTITAGAKNCSVKLHATFCVTIFFLAKVFVSTETIFHCNHGPVRIHKIPKICVSWTNAVQGFFFWTRIHTLCAWWNMCRGALQFYQGAFCDSWLSSKLSLVAIQHRIAECLSHHWHFFFWPSGSCLSL